MTKKRTIKKVSTNVARKRVAPIRKKKKTKDKIVKYTGPKMLGASGHLGMVMGAGGKIIKRLTSIAKHAVKKRAAKKLDKRK